MRQVFRYILMVTIALLTATLAEAQVRRDVQHKLRVTAAAGFSWDEEPDVIGGKAEATILSSAGVKPIVGFGYRMQYGHLLVDAGMDVAYRYVNDKWQTIRTEETSDFGDGKMWNVVVDKTNRHLHCHQLSVGVPVAIGFTYGYVYGTLGAKLGVGFPNRDSVTYLYTEARDNGMIANPIVYYRDDARGYGIADGMAIDVLLTAELGARLDKISAYRGYSKNRKKMHHYLAAFAEGGAYSTAQELEAMRRLPFTVGVKYTLEIEMKEKHRCVTCDIEEKKGGRK